MFQGLYTFDEYRAGVRQDVVDFIRDHLNSKLQHTWHVIMGRGLSWSLVAAAEYYMELGIGDEMLLIFKTRSLEERAQVGERGEVYLSGTQAKMRRELIS